MSPRIVKAGSGWNVRPVTWERLVAVPAAVPGKETADPELESALEQCRRAHDRIAELECNLAAETEKAFDRGVKQGRGEEHRKAQAEIESHAGRVAAAIADMGQVRSRWMHESEQDLVRLAIGVARRVLHAELSVDPESIHSLLKAAFERVEGCGLTRIVVSPVHEQAVREHLARTGAHGVEVMVDAALGFGGVRFETVHASIDASIDAQCEEIERALVQRLEP